ncbi:MAG: CBS domain-containing protein [Desulfobacteraceae bacterium]|nr:CBS domain-containing protein [Desulfobacteraceae bacterium]
MTKARDIMTKEVKYIKQDAYINEVVMKMKEEGVSSFVVEREGQDDAYGIITHKDIITKVIKTGRSLAHTKVEEIVTKPLLLVSPGLGIKHVVHLMAMANIRRAPVFDGEKIVGIISHSDIIANLQA